jgi:ABC-2 type transport system permease protein
VLHVVSDLMPLSYATDAMQHLVGSPVTSDVWGDLGIVVAFGAAALALGAATLRRRTP